MGVQRGYNSMEIQTFLICLGHDQIIGSVLISELLVTPPPLPPQICAIEFYYIGASIKRLSYVAGAVRARRARH